MPFITHRQIALIAFGIVAVFAATWIKKPELFSYMKPQAEASQKIQLPQYYAYEPSPEDSLPMVAGASTEVTGPSVLNEDGTLSPAIEPGDVLGFSTEDVVLPVESITVKQVADSEDAIKSYVRESSRIEADYINGSDFESALTSNNQQLIDQQAAKILRIRDSLQQLPVPSAFVRLHKLKVVQYDAAVEVLKNFTNADNNPELVMQKLGVFLKSQQDMEAEALTLSKQYDIYE